MNTPNTAPGPASSDPCGHQHTQPGDAADCARLARYLDGETGGLAELVIAHHDRLLRRARHLARGQIDPAEAVQEAWLSVAVRGHGFSGASSVGHWLTIITERKVLDALRRRRHQARLVDLLAADPAVTTTAGLVTASRDGRPATLHCPGTEARLDLAAAFAALSADHREVLWLRHGLGHSVADIAALLEVAPATVKSRAARARAALRALLDPPTGDEPGTADATRAHATGAAVHPGAPPVPREIPSFEAVLAELPERQQLAVRLIAIEQLSFTDAAAQLGRSRDTVRNQYFRGRHTIIRRQAEVAQQIHRAAEPGPAGQSPSGHGHHT